MRAVLRKFFADRGTHLAAMIAYFALLSFVPLLLLSLALLGLADQAEANSFFVRELQGGLPNASLDSILRAVHAVTEPRRHAGGDLALEQGEGGLRRGGVEQRLHGQ